MSDLFTPPRLFTKVKFQRHTDRAVGWLELFYDLVYVATLIQIGNFLSDNVSLLGFAQFLVLIAVVWWAWTGETFYQNRFVVDDITHRVLVFIQMFAVATIGISVSEAFGSLYIQFTLAYVLTRFILVVMYLRAMRTNPESAGLARGFAIGFSIGIAIWLGSLLLPAQYHWVGWLVGITVELCVPLTPAMIREQRAHTPDIHHIAERFGIFTIIVLGEAFVKILDDAQGTAIGLRQLAFSASGLTVLYSLWWLYFSDTAGKVIDFADRPKATAWVYGHLPLAAGLVAFAVGAKKLYGYTFDHPGDPANPDYRLLYTAAVAIYLVALALIDIGVDDELTHQSQRRESIVHLISAVVVVAIGLTATGASSTLFVTLIAVVMLAQVIYSITQTRDEFVATGHVEPQASLDFE